MSAFRHSGEIPRIAGLFKSRKLDLARALAGDFSALVGRIAVSEKEIRSPSIAAMNEAGVGYLPPDRREDVIPVLSVAANMSLARLTRADAGMLLDPGTELRDVEERIQALAIKTHGAAAPASALSGGNQQEVLLARCLMRNVKVLVLDNPTNGGDAGAKEEIYRSFDTSPRKESASFLLVTIWRRLSASAIAFWSCVAARSHLRGTRRVAPSLAKLTSYRTWYDRWRAELTQSEGQVDESASAERRPGRPERRRFP
jgi:ABC-type uncharacterized transport system ATPase subunit